MTRACIESKTYIGFKRDSVEADLPFIVRPGNIYLLNNYQTPKEPGEVEEVEEEKESPKTIQEP
jgi:hypothetical protein